MTAIHFLMEWALRSGALIVGGACLLWALRVKDSSVRLAAWTAMLCGSLAMPLLTAALPKAPWIRLAMPNVLARQGDAAWMFDPEAPGFGGAGSVQGARTSAHGVDASKSRDWPHFASTFYFILTGFFLLRLCAALVMSGRLLHGSRAAGQTAGGIEIRESDRVFAPLSLGIVRAAILLPSDWRDWDSGKLDAVLAHERSHILRRDPAVQLLSAVHRALLWPSPLSWYLHRSLVRVAEEASDDAAVAATRDRASYAELLLEFMQRSACDANWQGVAMARYAWPEERIHRILDGAALSRGGSRWRSAALLALGAPLGFIAAAAHLQPGTPSRLTFVSASVRLSPSSSQPGPVRALPGGTGYMVQDAPVKLMISLMYKVPMRQITGAPAWLDTEGYDIEAKADHAYGLNDLHAMFRTLLADRFKLNFHTEIKQGPIYSLTVDPSGLKMKANDSPELFDYPIKTTAGNGWVVVGTRVPMEYLCWWLAQGGGRPVIDKTGLNQNYDFRLSFLPALPPGVSKERLPVEIRIRPSIFDALRDQLGLRLEQQTGPVTYFVIDHIEKPAAN